MGFLKKIFDLLSDDRPKTPPPPPSDNVAPPLYLNDLHKARSLTKTPQVPSQNQIRQTK